MNVTDWLTAIGTISAVIVALYLSRRDRKPQALVTASFSYLVSPVVDIKDPIELSIEIVNRGLVPIYLKEVAIFLNKRSNQRMTYLDGSHKVERLLKPGEHYEHKLDYQ